MNQFFYLLKGTLYRSLKEPDDLIEINEVFENDNLIEARERIFEVYQNYIDVLLESKEMNFQSHDQANKDLKSFMLGSKTTNDLNLSVFFEQDIIHDFDKGLSIFLIQKKTKTFITLEGELIYETKLLIHDLNSEQPFVRKYMLECLLKEFAVYKANNYDCRNHQTSVWIANNNVELFETILQTPINYKTESIHNYSI